MSAKPEAAPATAMIVEREAVAQHLLDEETRYEPLVMLERGPGGARVRKLTMREKLDYADRTEGSVFAGSGEELEEMFALMDEQAERDAQGE